MASQDKEQLTPDSRQSKHDIPFILLPEPCSAPVEHLYAAVDKLRFDPSLT